MTLKDKILDFNGNEIDFEGAILTVGLFRALKKRTDSSCVNFVSVVNKEIKRVKDKVVDFDGNGMSFEGFVMTYTQLRTLKKRTDDAYKLFIKSVQNEQKRINLRTKAQERRDAKEWIKGLEEESDYVGSMEWCRRNL